MITCPCCEIEKSSEEMTKKSGAPWEFCKTCRSDRKLIMRYRYRKSGPARLRKIYGDIDFEYERIREKLFNPKPSKRWKRLTGGCDYAGDNANGGRGRVYSFCAGDD